MVESARLESEWTLMCPVSSNLTLSAMSYIYGEMAEWSKALDWKSSVRLKRRTAGSNPALSAKSGPC